MNVEVDEEVCIIQSMTDGTNTYLYGPSTGSGFRIAQTQGTTTDYFLSDALGSVRQLTDQTGAITYARTYDPYGVATQTTGAAQTPYGYTGEYTSNDLVYLRARHYDPAMGRFLTRDTWGGDAIQPMSYNSWLYVNSNPVNYTDPLGLFPTSYIFFFTGLGNNGDTNGDGKFTREEIDDRNAEAFLESLESMPNTKVVNIYPYGVGLTPESTDANAKLKVVIAAAYGLGSVAASKAEQVLFEIESGIGFVDCEIDARWPNPTYDNALQITFLAYSGGGQIAYSTAQKLSGKLQVDKLVLLGSPYRAYNATSNIGQLWELWGEQDFSGATANGLTKEDVYGGHLYWLSGWRTFNENYAHKGIYTAEWGGTQCIFKNNYDTNKPYYGHLSYFKSKPQMDGGVECTGAHPYSRGASGESRVDALTSFLKENVGIGKP